MSTNLNKFKGRTAEQLFLDRLNRDKKVKIKPIKGRILNDWDNPNIGWEPDENGVYRNNTYYGGNLQGAIDKLDYLQSLGIDLTYMNPICASVEYHGYDSTNQFAVDPWKGTWDDFEEYNKEAKKRDILNIADLAFNHSSIMNPLVTDPRYASWYRRKNGQLSYWFGFKNLPECNLYNQEYQDYCRKVIEFYLEKGVSGIRLDLGGYLPREFLYAIQRVKEHYPDTLIIGEQWDIVNPNDTACKIYSDDFNKKQLDSFMGNYPTLDGAVRYVRLGLDKHFDYIFKSIYEKYPKEVQDLFLNSIGSHDIPTVMTMMGGKLYNDNVFDGKFWDIEKVFSAKYPSKNFDTLKFRKFELENEDLTPKEYEDSKKLVKLVICIMYNLPGIPCLWQGTEIGSIGYKDPFNRRPYDWNKKEEDLLGFVKDMGKYRKENKDVLATGDVRIAHLDDSVLILERSIENKKIVMAVNRTNLGRPIKISKDISKMRILLRTNNSTLQFLAPYSICIGRLN